MSIWNTSSLKGNNRVLNQCKVLNLNCGPRWVCGVVWNDTVILDQFINKCICKHTHTLHIDR